MLSKIRVEYDFEKKEPYIQFNKANSENEDLADGMLKSFFENEEFIIEYDINNNPQLRIKK